MNIELYLMFIGIGVLLAIYSFIVNDNQNYTHIITSALSGIMFLLIGLTTYSGVTESYILLNNSTVTNHQIIYQPPAIAGFFTVFGVIMILYTLLSIWQLFDGEKGLDSYLGHG